MKPAVSQEVPAGVTSQTTSQTVPDDTSPATDLIEGLTSEEIALIKEAQQKAFEILEDGLARESELKHVEACSVTGRAEPGAEQGWHANSGVPLAYANARAAFRAELMARAAAQAIDQAAEILWERADTLAAFCGALNRAALMTSHQPRFAPLGGALLGGMGGLGCGDDDYLTHQLGLWFTRAVRHFNQGKSITGREVRLREFIAKRAVTVARVRSVAIVDKGDFSRWRNGKLPSSSAKSERIENVLCGLTAI